MLLYFPLILNRTAIRVLLLISSLIGVFDFNSDTRYQADAAEGRLSVNAIGSVQTVLPTGLPDFDIRAAQERSQSLLALESLNETQDRFSLDTRRRIQGSAARWRLFEDNPRLNVRWSSLTGRPSRMFNLGGPIRMPRSAVSRSSLTTPPPMAEAHRLAREFLASNTEIFGLQRSSISRLRADRSYRTDHNGVTHIFLQQSLGDIDLFQARMAVHLDRAGDVIATGGELFPE
ncbi:MAG: hypothetical protein ABI882_13100, partial [Acidobacteriota bacterium]